jgi:hypothetical protein
VLTRVSTRLGQLRTNPLVVRGSGREQWNPTSQNRDVGHPALVEGMDFKCYFGFHSSSAEGP